MDASPTTIATQKAYAASDLFEGLSHGIGSYESHCMSNNLMHWSHDHKL